jgi:hypothetical protein
MRVRFGATIGPGKAAWVKTMRVLRSITKAVLAVHRWFMKYSGTTMIIDSIEERRRLRKSEESAEEDPGNRDRRGTPPGE